jgi:hypothetical protein
VDISLWRQAGELPDQEDNPPGDGRLRCPKGHFIGRQAASRYWQEIAQDKDGAPVYSQVDLGLIRAEGITRFEMELWCPACRGWVSV